jgi:predicted DNA-binding transcriptional regulator YafY
MTDAVIIRYRNHRGEIADRRILPRSLRFGASQWHPGQQWLLEATDLDKGQDRTFAMQDILAWSALAIDQADEE